MKANYWLLALGCMSMMTSMHAFSASIVIPLTYGSGSAAGQSAGTCIATASELAPFSVPRNIIVDNSVPNGTVLYEWDYSNFIPSISLRCQPSGISNNTISSLSSRFLISSGLTSYSTTSNAYVLNNSAGVGIRLYANVTSVGINAPRVINPITQSWVTSPLMPLNQEVRMERSSSSTFTGIWIQAGGGLNDNVTASRDQYDVKVRAALVKVGNIVYGPLTLPVDTVRFQSPDIAPRFSNFNNITGISAITLVPPQCRLSTPNSYAINLGLWVARGVGTRFPSATLPLGGTGVPLNIGLECNGGLNDVQFSFQDAGVTPQTNGSVGLYDSSGNKIAGLEVEMRYNNTRINVGKSTDATSVLSKVSVGARTGGNDSGAFTAATPAQFTAHFVQRNPITRGGVSYAGPVSGQVNIWVTYN